uniref:Uncharacterized protein n=1 Tax=Arundo donax TaxID=35708 RepID=A0A0A8Z9B7_ARUDO
MQARRDYNALTDPNKRTLELPCFLGFPRDAETLKRRTDPNRRIKNTQEHGSETFFSFIYSRWSSPKQTCRTHRPFHLHSPAIQNLPSKADP